MTVSTLPADTGPITGAVAVAWIHAFDAAVTQQAVWLTELDAAIGDADHGTIMRLGASAIGRAADLNACVGSVLTAAGTTFAAATGGAGGILFATFFQGVGAALTDRPSATLRDFADAFAAGVSLVQIRGRAESGDKTMIDALIPAARSLQHSADEGTPVGDAFAEASIAAETGRDATIPLIARKGRASYLGDRSAGHLDPGAATAAILLAALHSATVSD